MTYFSQSLRTICVITRELSDPMVGSQAIQSADNPNQIGVCNRLPILTASTDMGVACHCCSSVSRLIGHSLHESNWNYSVCVESISDLLCAFVCLRSSHIDCILGSKAIDVIMESKWACKKDGEFLFSTREDATMFMNELLQKKFFYRAMRNMQENKGSSMCEKNDMDVQKNQNLTDRSLNASPGESSVRRRKLEKVGENGKTEVITLNQKSEMKEKKPKEKVKKRYKLSVHDEQIFSDSKELYVWLYNPVSPKTIVMGLAVLLCVVAATLFPLWPPQVRMGVYYLSLAGGGFIGSIFVVALARSILYGLIWAFSGGKHHLWILPNILADVGFFESFKPFYTYEYRGKSDGKDANCDKSEEKSEDSYKEDQMESEEEKGEPIMEKDN